jgi:transcription elongation factor Elf1
MTDPTEQAHSPTCSFCGASRSSTAVPYHDADNDFAVYTCASCGQQFESWSSQSAADQPAHTLGHDTD